MRLPRSRMNSARRLVAGLAGAWLLTLSSALFAQSPESGDDGEAPGTENAEASEPSGEASPSEENTPSNEASPTDEDVPANESATTEDTTDDSAERDETGVILSRDVRARTGDSFVRIARRELGSARYAHPLAEFNELNVNEPLSVGQRIRIPIMVPSRNEAANVIFVKGDARRNGRRIRPNERIRRGDNIETGDDGFVTIEFGNGTVINLQPETRATLKRLNCVPKDDSCFIELRSAIGTFSSDVQSRDNQPTEFRITTPYAAAAVRGTEFDFLGDSEALRVGVTEGEVAISAQQQVVSLDEGFGSITEAGEPPGAATPLLPAPVFRTVPPRVADGDRVRWWSLTEAERYAATVSIDSDETQVIADFDSDEPTLDITELSPGDFYLNLWGIDRSGIPGFHSSTLVTVAEIEADAQVPVTQVTREGRTYLVEVVDPSDDAQGFEIQLSIDPDFPDPQIADVGPSGRARFALDADIVYTRARQLLNPRLVSAFGEPVDNR